MREIPYVVGQIAYIMGRDSGTSHVNTVCCDSVCVAVKVQITDDVCVD